MTKFKIKRVRFEKSNRYITESNKPVLPTIIYWNESIGNHRLITLKFVFWKWWVKTCFIIVHF